ncbi:hypothetical protein BJ322DRAFT_1167873 [Thelephora terrestris]|uniref:Erythromycin biosynthesis protein CIII-like C-terminal domain-containing protein n=1 Tax=Thelephora terrestris TaxID=56493 RepID=A0A9P6H4Y3_9AGAM|nr:hypothetical protein BJ322DRAFT_1167873 [Thelephora terrestris]
MSSHNRKTVLFLTVSEAGQSNSILALALELLTHPNIDSHIASFPILQKRVEQLSSTAKVADRIDWGVDSPSAIGQKPRTGYEKPHAYASGLEWKSCKNIINAVDPNIVVVDSFFGAGCEACWSLSKSAALHLVLRASGIGSGIPFPIPWSYVLKNVTILLAFMWRVLTDPDVKELTNYRHEHGLPGRLPLPGDFSIIRSVHAFCFGLPELDLPLILPPNFGLYRLVTLNSIQLPRGDELSEWLDRGRTIVIAFRAGTSPMDQVLWKVRNMVKFQHILDEELENERVKERFRIVEWINVDPGEVIRNENVVACVHHGGASSYFETARAGIPQIILAQWFDLYDMAVRAEYVGIGIYDMSSELRSLDYSPSEEAGKFAREAREIGELCRAAPGKKGVAAKILELAEDENLQ